MSDLPFHDRDDSDDAGRGFVARLDPGVIRNSDGRVVWDGDSYAFLQEECPDSAHPGLWRQGRLCARQGLYEVTEGVYQVRGLDLSNMTLVEGEHGVVVVDPLVSVECAAAALGLYRAHRGHRPVTGVVYTHSHADHFGGVRGVTSGGVPILAPDGFMEHAASEHGHARSAVTRRSVYTYGQALERSPLGQIGAGLGLAASTGAISFVPPTVTVTRTGQEEVVDGVRMEFQLMAGAGDPPQMAFLLPGHRALFLAENVTRDQHDLLPLHGAAVRDPRVWVRCLTETITRFAGRADVALASHHWPVWGADAVARFLTGQRDLHTYLHDQTLRLMNKGLTASEIAETLPLPPALEDAWHTRGYHGALSQHVRAVYQRYLGWFDGNPAHLWEHPPRESAIRYVRCLGGGGAVVEFARGYLSQGDLRFAAQLLNHAVFADEGNKEARDLLAEVYTRLGHGAENATWRNLYLTGALELADGIVPAVPAAQCPDLVAALPVDRIFDSIAIRLHGPRAWNESLAIDWHLTDLGERHRTTLSNGALVRQQDPPDGPVDLTLRLSRQQLVGLLCGRGAEGVEREGNIGALQRLVALLDDAMPDFPVVTP
ncbi:MBL fold metallo-hydrolase [Nonomuraea sp. 3-1Str]|uniref:alkyl/aryl-sulfatase n=1 Tax=Nonomuraea sp. 3-1Str TaxID=2929801 RepID=UPI0028657138|nr:alkyl sulfatase dimerization domain-containing protein [Nonomuraea sp. 3-1Str]MDR8407307.1 MBL fold metallo-hydrolase [Nonomuraea sp. 3-1Str]